jgi:phospholipase C
MGYYPSGFLPALHGLAEAFMVCDRWHASVPGPTWPNRFFALTGTSNGRVNMPDDGTHKSDLAGYMQQTQDTIFDRLSERGIEWKVYFHDIPQTTVLAHQRRPANAARYFYISEFFSDARGDESEFPQFSFIEPSYMGWGQNDDHPPFDVMRAEKLIADIYNAVRANQKLWEKTLLVIYYDEHGGFYDHVVPPAAPPPDEHHEEYAFDRLGVRVPALLVSPWVERRVEHTLFDHTSVLKYLIDKWTLEPLGRRTAAANSIAAALTRTSPRADTPNRIELAPDQLRPPDPEAEEKAFGRRNGHQQALSALATYLKREVVNEAVVAVPRFYAWLSRLIVSSASALRSWADKLAGAPASVRVSLAAPDRLAHHNDIAPKEALARYLMRQKRLAVPQLAAQIRATHRASAEHKHAVRTLGLLTGRQYHNEEAGSEHALGWLARHGQ